MWDGEGRDPNTPNAKRKLSPQEKRDRKQRVLTKQTPSIARSISSAIVIKDEDVFLLTQRDGTVPIEPGHGFGLFYHDCRYLNGYELRLAGVKPDSLVATGEKGYMALHELTNPDLHLGERTLLPKEHLGVRWERVVDGASRALHERLIFYNFGQERYELPIAFKFRAEFEDLYVVRGLLREDLGTLEAPSWSDGTLHFRYQGRDDLLRSLYVHLRPSPDETDGTEARFVLRLDPQQTCTIQTSLAITERKKLGRSRPTGAAIPNFCRMRDRLEQKGEEELSGSARVESDSLLLNGILERSLRDLRTLRSSLGREAYFAAGIPWFATLFGRDSIIASLQTLAFAPEIAEQTLRVLAARQGTRKDEWRDEEPGKILHELRVGEMARLDEIPHSAYYGTVDATPLFLILIGEYVAWTGDLTLFRDLRKNVELALTWIAEYGDSDGDGYVDYTSGSGGGLVNQGWKDSGDAIVNGDGSMARSPIALVEVQGYVYLAKTLIAGLLAREGKTDKAERLRREAEDLRNRFNRDYWLDHRGFYALALQQGGNEVAVLSSNPGHALWSGIAIPDKAKEMAGRLMEDDMFSGWGIRTLSSRERRYNPIGYHLGSVWQHDNSIIAAGLRRYGFDDAAGRIFAGMMAAAGNFRMGRLPELFAGFERDRYGIPVHYPVACHPQAWAAGSVPYLLTTALGLTPEAFEHRLRIRRPFLPEHARTLELRGLRVGKAKVDLRFQRNAGESVSVEICKLAGELDVVVEPD
jgi:glycogen debranching enzyme